MGVLLQCSEPGKLLKCCARGIWSAVLGAKGAPCAARDFEGAAAPKAGVFQRFGPAQQWKGRRMQGYQTW